LPLTQYFMSTRRIVLRDLASRHESGNGGYTRPMHIPGFSKQPARYQAAINALLQERLINGTKDGDGHLAIAVNTQRLADVRKELRSWYTRAALLAVGLSAVLAAVVFALR
jgi:hypothetical protein